MNNEQLKAEKQRLDNKFNWINNVLTAYIDGRYVEMGLVADEVKTASYVALKREHALIFEELRTFNGKYAKQLHKADA